MRHRRDHERGFVLIAVLVILAITLTGLTVVLREAGTGLREAGSARSKEMVVAAIDQGVSEAIDRLQVMDPLELADLSNDWDVFSSWTPPSGPFIPDTTFPPAGMPYAGDLGIRVGLRRSQRTRAPAGEDVNKSYGVVMEVQVSVRRENVSEPAGESVSVGVRLPRTHSHAN